MSVSPMTVVITANVKAFDESMRRAITLTREAAERINALMAPFVPEMKRLERRRRHASWQARRRA